jgi:hypothetical protein
MRLAGSTALLVAFASLTSPTPVFADCAFVLWSEENTSYFSYRMADAKAQGGKMDQKDIHSWTILGSYSGKNVCEKQRDSKMSSMLKSWKRDKPKADSGEHTVNQDSGSNTISKRSVYAGDSASTYATSLRYLCLPDTVDPRKPK